MRVADNPDVSAAVIAGSNSRQRVTRPAGDPMVEMAAFESGAGSDPAVEVASFAASGSPNPVVETGSFACST